jgi:RNA polymerase sigma-70 factor (ECF subfamily)
MPNPSDLCGRQQMLRHAIDQSPELLAFLRRQLAEPTDAHDLLQELYLRILKLRKLDAIRSPRAYLFRVATNLAYEHRRRLSATGVHLALEELDVHSIPEMQGFSNAPESAALMAERLEHVTTRLSELSPKVQRAILWHHRDGYTCEEIGTKLAVVRNRVKKYLVRGLTHCRAGSTAIGSA